MGFDTILEYGINVWRFCYEKPSFMRGTIVCTPAPARLDYKSTSQENQKQRYMITIEVYRHEANDLRYMESSS